MAKGRNAARGAKSSGSPEGLNPQQLRKLTAALSKATSLPALLKLHATHGPSFNGFHVGALWKRLKHLAVSAQGQSYLLSNSSQLEPLCIQTSQMLPTLDTRAIATVALAMSSAGLLRGLPWEEVWPLIRESTAAKLSQFEPRELADVAWSFALVGGKFSHPCLPICHTPLFVTRHFLSRATFLFDASHGHFVAHVEQERWTPPRHSLDNSPRRRRRNWIVPIHSLSPTSRGRLPSWIPSPLMLSSHLTHSSHKSHELTSRMEWTR